jgi:biopolymer transport protein ExbB/TolQ
VKGMSIIMWFFIIALIIGFSITIAIITTVIFLISLILRSNNDLQRYQLLNNARNSAHCHQHKFEDQQFMDETNRQNQQLVDETNRQNQQLVDEANRQNHRFMDEQFVNWNMEEGMKSVTPFEHGGYNVDIGNSFNNNQHISDSNNISHNNNDFNSGF